MSKVVYQAIDLTAGHPAYTGPSITKARQHQRRIVADGHAGVIAKNGELMIVPRERGWRAYFRRLWAALLNREVVYYG